VTTATLRRAHLPVGAVVLLAGAAWLAAWFINLPAANWLAFDLLRLEPGTHLGDAVAFFVYDVPKVLLLLLGIVTLVTFARSYFPAERVRAALAGRGTLAGTVAAAGFGVITPFCSCSAVPLFIGFVEAGIPLGVTFAFLISSPMVNEVALVLLWGLFGPGIALLYMAAGLSVAMIGGLVLGRLPVERWIEPWVLEIRSNGGGRLAGITPGVEERLRDAWAYTRGLVRKVAPYVVAGIAIGALIHGYAPMDLVAAIGGNENPLAVPLVVVLAVPLYSNAAGTIPIVEALLGKGMPLGTTLAFMMAVVAISLPEFIILRKVMRLPLLGLFAGVVVAGILAVGIGFNALGL
jgi:uncharacterized membrane protein YraQ (UPF0718 family)